MLDQSGGRGRQGEWNQKLDVGELISMGAASIQVPTSLGTSRPHQHIHLSQTGPFSSEVRLPQRDSGALSTHSGEEKKRQQGSEALGT